MKNKSFNKKLSINKITVSNLQTVQMGRAKAGAAGTEITCRTDEPGCDPNNTYTCPPPSLEDCTGSWDNSWDTKCHWDSADNPCQ